MKNRIKKLLPNGKISRPAHIILNFGLIISCLLLATSLCVAVRAGALSPHTYKLHHLYRELYNTPQGILLITAIGALIADDIAKR